MTQSNTLTYCLQIFSVSLSDLVSESESQIAHLVDWLSSLSLLCIDAQVTNATLCTQIDQTKQQHARLHAKEMSFFHCVICPECSC